MRVVDTKWEMTLASKDKFLGPRDEGRVLVDSKAVEFFSSSKGISKLLGK